MTVVKDLGYIREVPQGCKHPPLRMRGFILETMIGCTVALALAVITQRLTQ